MDGAPPRVVQYGGRRVGIRMESTYWTALRARARREGCAFNELVHRLYDDPRAGTNRTAFLRRAAMTWLAGEVVEAQRKLSLGESEMESVLHTTRRPALLTASDGSVTRVNAALHDWLHLRIHVGGDDLVARMRVGFRTSRAALYARVVDNGGWLHAVEAAVLVPGRALPARVDLVQIRDTQGFLAIIDTDPG